jgi:glycosyltransferase involved in cell wall biosynthesis
VRLREIILTRFYDHFILAEKCYQAEIRFIGNRYTILENKFASPLSPLKLKSQDKITLLLSGTLSKEYGVMEAIKFFRQLPSEEFELTLVGHCPVKQTLLEMNKLVDGFDNIKNLVSSEPVTHAQILDQVGDKTIGLLPYQPNKSTQNKIPTKLYEYIAIGIPILITPNPTWENIINKYNAGLAIDFYSPPQIDIIHNSITLMNTNYSNDLKDVMWNNEEIKLLSLIKRIFSI